MVGTLKTFKLFFIFITLVLVLAGCNKEDKVIKIGITQIAEHNALDRNREGFIAGLASRGFVEGDNVEFDYQNAQGNTSTASLIAQTFVAKRVDMIFAVATPSAQAAKNATKDIPILFSAVTDPVAAGLVNSLESPGKNLTGTSDITPIDKQFNLIKTLFPNKTRIGIVYNTSETNSEVQVNLAQTVALQLGLTLNVKGVTNAQELSLALDILLNEIDILYIPTDNLIASSMSVVTSKANSKLVPVIGSEEAQVEEGALLTEGLDYYNLGFQTGLMAADILEKKGTPKTMAVQTLEETKLVVNNNTAAILNFTLPESLKERSNFINK